MTARQLAESSPLPMGLTLHDWPGLPVRAVHLDLKFHPPRYDAVFRWLDQLAAWKINTLVLEYEDRFPYERYVELSASTAWTREQVQALVSRANRLGIEVVPLIQSLGHVEYILRHSARAGLRELPHVLSQYCPSNPGSFDLFVGMASQVLALHPHLRYLHVGGDETGFLGRCPRCAERAKTLGPIGLYAEHLRKVCDWVAAQGIRPILWDDMLRSDFQQIQRLPRSAVLMFWDYGATGVITDRRKRRRSPPMADPDQWTKGPAVDPPPYLRYREEGYDVILASCYNGEGLIPLANTANIRYLAQEAAIHGGLGSCATHWAVFGVAPEAAAYGVAAAADAAWNPLPSRDDVLTDLHGGPGIEFDRRFCRAWFGLPDDTLFHALRLLDRGPLYLPSDGHAYPTLYADWCFVDMTFQVDRETMAAFGSAYFRPDWATPVQNFSWERAWQDKVAALRREPSLPAIRVLLRELAERQERGLSLLRGERSKATQHQSLLEGMEAGAVIRLWRTQNLLHELGGPRPTPQPEAVDRYRAFLLDALSDADAQQLVAWQTVGLEFSPAETSVDHPR